MLLAHLHPMMIISGARPSIREEASWVSVYGGRPLIPSVQPSSVSTRFEFVHIRLLSFPFSHASPMKYDPSFLRNAHTRIMIEKKYQKEFFQRIFES
eukprot:gene11611-8000_t